MTHHFPLQHLLRFPKRNTLIVHHALSTMHFSQRDGAIRRRRLFISHLSVTFNPFTASPLLRLPQKRRDGGGRSPSRLSDRPISRHKEKPVSSRRRRKPSLRSEIPDDARRPDDGIRENSARTRARLTRAVIIVARTVVLFRSAIKSSVYRGSRLVECRKTRRRSELSALQRSCTDALPVTPGDTAAPRLCIQILRDESLIKSNLARSKALSNL